MMLLPMLLAAGSCPPQIEYVEVRPVVAAELLEPVPISNFRPKTYRDLAKLATQHLESAQKANAKIVALGKIVGPR